MTRQKLISHMVKSGYGWPELADCTTSELVHIALLHGDLEQLEVLA